MMMMMMMMSMIVGASNLFDRFLFQPHSFAGSRRVSPSSSSWVFLLAGPRQVHVKSDLPSGFGGASRSAERAPGSSGQLGNMSSLSERKLSMFVPKKLL